MPPAPTEAAEEPIEAAEQPEEPEAPAPEPEPIALEDVPMAIADFVGSGGTGGEGDPYQIKTLDDLKAFAQYINEGNTGASEYFKLTAPIDMSSEYSGRTGTSWTPIGNETNQFQGTFDGGDSTISGIYISNSDDAQGLFGYIGAAGVVKNLTVGGSITANTYVGSIAGCSDGTIEIVITRARYKPLAAIPVPCPSASAALWVSARTVVVPALKAATTRAR